MIKFGGHHASKFGIIYSNGGHIGFNYAHTSLNRLCIELICVLIAGIWSFFCNLIIQTTLKPQKNDILFVHLLTPWIYRAHYIQLLDWSESNITSNMAQQEILGEAASRT